MKRWPTSNVRSRLNPDPETHSNVLMAINYHPGYSPSDLLTAHKSWAELHEKPHIPNWKPHTNDRDPDRKLPIGYVSPDFRGHAVSFFVEPILQHHDHGHFEVFGYAHLTYADMSTWKMRSQIDQWREISLIDPQTTADKIREDQIDILIELAGHTANNALTTFARRPAPVQINMIGFPSTTGLTAIDYRITDDAMRSARRESIRSTPNRCCGCPTFSGAIVHRTVRRKSVRSPPTKTETSHSLL